MKIEREFNFDSAHYLSDYNGECANLHGHTFFLKITLEGSIDPKTNMVLDFTELKKVVKKEILDKIDHRCLNEIFDFNPTCENIVRWIYKKLEKKIKLLYSIELREGLGGSAIYSESSKP